MIIFQKNKINPTVKLAEPDTIFPQVFFFSLFNPNRFMPCQSSAVQAQAVSVTWQRAWPAASHPRNDWQSVWWKTQTAEQKPPGQVNCWCHFRWGMPPRLSNENEPAAYGLDNCGLAWRGRGPKSGRQRSRVFPVLNVWKGFLFLMKGGRRLIVSKSTNFNTFKRWAF